MKAVYLYTSRWKAKSPDFFELCGVIAAGYNRLGVYFPEDRLEQEEWQSWIGRVMETSGQFSPIPWLRQLAESGNGITEEFDRIREIRSASLDDALREAYERTLGEFGHQMKLYTDATPGVSQSHYDPLADLRPVASTPVSEENGYEHLFDGTAESFRQWRSVGAGSFDVMAGELVTRPGRDLGLLFYEPRTFADYSLRLEFALHAVEGDSGVFVRFRDPRLPVPDPIDPNRLHPYENPAWIPVNTGFEVQISSEASHPHDREQHRTGVIYGIPLGSASGQQAAEWGTPPVMREWNELEVLVQGDHYRVMLNGETTTQFFNTDPHRGRSPLQDPASGYIGLQCYLGFVAFRRIRIKSLP